MTLDQDADDLCDRLSIVREVTVRFLCDSSRSERDGYYVSATLISRTMLSPNDEPVLRGHDESERWGNVDSAVCGWRD